MVDTADHLAFPKKGTIEDPGGWYIAICASCRQQIKYLTDEEGWTHETATQLQRDRNMTEDEWIDWDDMTPEQQRSIIHAPCDMKQAPPFDFAWCETHDTTFPLGGTCNFNETAT